MAPPRPYLCAFPIVSRLFFYFIPFILHQLHLGAEASVSLASPSFQISRSKHDTGTRRPFRASPCCLSAAMSSTTAEQTKKEPFLSTVLFVECGFGNDSHGQNATKAAVRACRNAIEFNSIPSVAKLVPNGYDGLKLDVVLAVPKQYQASLDLQKAREVFPYGQVQFTVQDGGMIAPSGIAIDSLGDTNDDMVVVCCAVSVGY